MNYKYDAFVNLKANLICLNPKNRLKDYGCRVGTFMYRPTSKEKIIYKWGEQYFHTLLHEIAHFKIKKKPPKEWMNLVGKLLITAIKNENRRRRNLGNKPLTAKEEKEYIYDIDDNYLSNNAKLYQRKGEISSHYLKRCKDFRNWLIMNDYSAEHILVEKWARKEFKKCRKQIRKVLNNSCPQKSLYKKS
jgi:hypothetical protein